MKILHTSSDALSTKTTGGYVSCRKRILSPRARKPKIAAKYSVHRHPRFGFMTVKPPINGASKGPVNTVMLKTVTANPLVPVNLQSQQGSS